MSGKPDIVEQWEDAWEQANATGDAACMSKTAEAMLATISCQAAEVERLREVEAAVRRYESECTNPSLDLLLRRRRRDELFSYLEATGDD